MSPDPAAEADAPAGGDAAPPVDSVKVFMGNLAWKVDEHKLQEAFEDCGQIVDITWFTDKATGQFKGAAIVEFDSKEAAGKAVAAEGREVLGRNTKCRSWEEREKTSNGQGRKPLRDAVVRPMSEKPEGCYTLFCGNLAFDVTEEQVKEFFAPATISNIRWLTNRDTGDFRGVAFIDFADDDSLDAAAKKNGERLAGRGVRLDYQAPKQSSW